MKRNMNWKTEYSRIRIGDVVVWKDFIYKCIGNLEYGVRKAYLEKVWENLQTTDFCKCPASTRYHHAYVSGLLKHTCETIALAFSFDGICDTSVQDDELLTCSLLHDYGKVGKYVSVKDADKNVAAFKYVDRGAELSDQLRSVVYAVQMIPDISDPEIFAILYHDGLYPDENMRSKNKETPLQLMIHWADMWSARQDQFGW